MKMAIFIFIILFVFGFLILSSSVSALNKTYDFSDTYEGINIWAYGADEVEDEPPPPNSNPPSGFTLTDKTTSAGWDSSDNSDVQDWILTISGAETFQLFNTSISENTDDITSLNWSYEGSVSATTGTAMFYVWNYTASDWLQCASNHSSTSDVLRNCSFTGVSDIINNGVTTFMVYYDNVDTTVVGLDTDYIY